MQISKLSQSVFEEWADSGSFLVVVWCGERDLGDSLLDYARALSSQVEGGRFGCVMVEDESGLAAMFGINDTPALMLMREQVVLYCEPGLPTLTQFSEYVARAMALDMASVHAAIQQEKEAEVALRMRRVCPTARRTR